MINELASKFQEFRVKFLPLLVDMKTADTVKKLGVSEEDDDVFAAEPVIKKTKSKSSRDTIQCPCCPFKAKTTKQIEQHVENGCKGIIISISSSDDEQSSKKSKHDYDDEKEYSLKEVLKSKSKKNFPKIKVPPVIPFDMLSDAVIRNRLRVKFKKYHQIKLV